MFYNERYLACSTIEKTEEKMEKNCETCYYRDLGTNQCHSVNPCNKIIYSEWYPRVKEEKMEGVKKEYKQGKNWIDELKLTPINIYQTFNDAHGCDSFWVKWDLFLDRFPAITRAIPIDKLVSWVVHHDLHKSFIKRGIIEEEWIPPRERIRTGSLWECNGKIYILAVLTTDPGVGLINLEDGCRWRDLTVVYSPDDITNEEMETIKGSREFTQLKNEEMLLIPKGLVYEGMEQYIIKRR